MGKVTGKPKLLPIRGVRKQLSGSQKKNRNKKRKAEADALRERAEQFFCRQEPNQPENQITGNASAVQQAPEASSEDSVRTVPSVLGSSPENEPLEEVSSDNEETNQQGEEASAMLGNSSSAPTSSGGSTRRDLQERESGESDTEVVENYAAESAMSEGPEESDDNGVRNPSTSKSAMSDRSDLEESGRAMSDHSDLEELGRAMSDHSDLEDSGRAVSDHSDLEDSGRAVSDHSDLDESGHEAEKPDDAFPVREAAFDGHADSDNGPLEEEGGDDVSSSGSEESDSDSDSSKDDDQDVIDTQDPTTWTRPLTLLQITKLLSEQRIQTFPSPVPKFPLHDGHRFNTSYFTGFKPNGEPYQRHWLRYSSTSNSLYCIPCCVYSIKNISNSSWMNYGAGETGCQDFRHMKRALEGHEKKYHRDCVLRAQEFIQNMNDESSVIRKATASFESNLQQWRNILRGILDAILYLAKNDLALQGHSRNIRDDNCGNFLNLIKLLAKYYPPLTNLVNNMKKNSTNYLSPRIQNEFIDICGNSVRSTILAGVRKRKYYSIMFDSTPDVSRQDQISQVIRTVECSVRGCAIEENFVDFINTTDKTGLALSEMILKKLNKDGLSILDCKGQSYDNGANMAGAYSGVQKRIQDKNPEATFVPCAAHSLNLVGVNAAERVLEAKLILGKVQNLFVFFSSSTSRWKALKSRVKVTLKGQSSTRWSSKANAVSALCSQYGKIIEVLQEISASETFSADVCSEAESKLRDLFNFKFLLGLTIWNRILFQINQRNVFFQAKVADIEKCQVRLSALREWLLEFQKNGFTTSYSQAEDVAKTIGIDVNSGFLDVRRTRGINRKYIEEEDFIVLRSQTNQERFKNDFFDKLMSNLNAEMDKRFHSMRKCSENFGFLWGENLNSYDENKMISSVKDLCNLHPNDLNPSSFVNEISSLKTTIAKFGKTDVSSLGPLGILNILYTNCLDSSYVNTETALRIFLTLPVSVASSERSFSKLKLIKNYLRSTMGQERLTNLAILSIERGIVDNMDFDKIIDTFALKQRKVPLHN